jgi:ribonuclease P protein component
VERNRVKRRLREAWRERLGQVQGGRDYVLIARPALGESLSGRDAGWLAERVDEVLGKAAA